MKKFITFCVAVLFGTMLLNGPVLSEASKVPAEDKALTEETPGESVPNKDGTMPNVVPNKPPVIQKWPGLFDCGPTEVILGIVTGKYGEKPMVRMDGIIQIPGGKVVGAPTLIYFNPESTTFSIVQHFQNGFSCILIYGKNVVPVNIQPEGSGTSAPRYFDKDKPPKEFKIDKKEFKWRGTGHTDILVSL